MDRAIGIGPSAIIKKINSTPNQRCDIDAELFLSEDDDGIFSVGSNLVQKVCLANEECINEICQEKQEGEHKRCGVLTNKKKFNCDEDSECFGGDYIPIEYRKQKNALGFCIN